MNSKYESTPEDKRRNLLNDRLQPIVQKAFSICNSQNLRKKKKKDLSSLLGSSFILLCLLHDAQLDALAARERHPRLRALPDRVHVAHARRELVAHRVCHVDDVEAAFVLLSVLDHSDPPSVSPARHHHDVADVELDELHHLPCLQVDLHRVVGLDQRVRVSVSQPIVTPNSENAHFQLHGKT